MRTFKQLTTRDRTMIGKLLDQGLSLAEIARRVGKNKSTLSRELRRNAQSISTAENQIFWMGVHNLWTKRETLAHLRTLKKSQRPKDRPIWTPRTAQRIRNERVRLINPIRTGKKGQTIRWVLKNLKKGWSPEQIAGRSKTYGPESVSHEFIYQLVWRDKRRDGELHRLLRRYRRRKQRFGNRNYSWAARIPNRVGIENRPKVVEKRSCPGDLEADLIQGHKRSGYILSVIDRRSRYLILRRLKTKDKSSVRTELEKAIRQIGRAQTLTVDNGLEFSDHLALKNKTGVRVYFARPYCSTERGSIENANGLVRYYLPKRKRFLWLSQGRLTKIQQLLNDRPRKCLGFLTPHEFHAMSKFPTGRSSSVAFDI